MSYPVWTYLKNGVWSQNTDFEASYEAVKEQDVKEAVKQMGFEHIHTYGQNDCSSMEIYLYRSEGHSYLLDLWSECGLGMVFCPTFPDLIDFMAKYGALFQMETHELLRGVLNESQIFFDEVDGLELVKQRNRRIANIRRQRA